jgi:metal-responsive CopG/Arc/MetJ family transcriptional regulator
MSVSEIVRRAIDEFIERQDRRQQDQEEAG